MAPHIDNFKILLYGSDIWVVMVAMLKSLEGINHRSAWRITEMTARRTEDKEWEYPLVADSMEPAGIWPIKEYIQRRKSTITAQVACQKIYEICNGAELMPVSSRLMRWWDQDVGRKEE